ncbi:serine protease, partial [Deinococcus sp. HMF7620]|nr:serine protease [Deinococcus arboris]
MSQTVYQNIEDKKIVDLLLEFFLLQNARLTIPSTEVPVRDQPRIKYLTIDGKPQKFIFKNVIEFIEEKGIEPSKDSLSYEGVCKRLVNEGLLIQMGNTQLTLFTPGEYSTISYREGIAEYGGYTMLLNGFRAVRERFLQSVVQVEVESDDSGETVTSRGSAFYLGKGKFATAKHVVMDPSRFRILIGEQAVEIRKIVLSDEAKLDLAILEADEADISIPSIT